MKTISIITIILGTFFWAIGSGTLGESKEKIAKDGGMTMGTHDPLLHKKEKLLGDERNIFWVHGLSGSSDSWATAAGAVMGTHHVISYTPSYPEFDLLGSGRLLHGKLISEAGNNPSMDNYIIAHSQGGLVSRAADKYYIDHNYPNADRMFGGIATFGTPHAGARIINNFPKIDAFTTDAFNAISAGPAEEGYENLPFIAKMFVDRDDVLTILKHLSQFAAKVVDAFILDGLQASITDDYKVGAQQLAELNATPHRIPAAAFYGVEHEPVAWRVLHSMQNMPNEQDPFTADEDQGYVDDANKNMNSWYMKYKSYENLAEEIDDRYECPWWAWFLSLGVGCAGLDIVEDRWNWDEWGLGDEDAKRISRAYYKGYDWWYNANEKYKTLIGAVEYKKEKEYMCQCVNISNLKDEDPDNDQVNFRADDPAGCKWIGYPVCSVTGVLQNNYRKEYENDGVVLAESAKAYPGADSGPDNALIGSNHFQMRNDRNLKKKLYELFDGKHGDYFTTDER